MINYNKVNNAVGRALRDYEDSTFPLNTYHAIKKISNISIATYKEIIDSPLFPPLDTEEKIINYLTLSNDGAILTDDGVEFLLAYNDSVDIPYTRIRWTIAHELGHYYLNHLDNKTIMSRGGLSNKDYDHAEKEANLFARDFLANPASCKLLNDYNDEKEIEEKFEVSREASKNIAENLKRNPWLIEKWDKHLSIANPIFNKVINYSEYFPAYGEDVFDLIITKSLVFNYCYDCHALNSGSKKNIKYCSVCNGTKILVTKHNFKFHENEEQNVIEYKKYNVQGNPSKLQDECAVCRNIIHNNENFCDVCGTYLINRCSGISADNIYFDNKSQKWKVIESGQDYQIESNEYLSGLNNGCDYPQSGKSRFCAKCGSVTTFMVQNLFEEWKVELKSLTSSEDTLPF